MNKVNKRKHRVAPGFSGGFCFIGYRERYRDAKNI